MQTEITLPALQKQFRMLRLLSLVSLLAAGLALASYFLDKWLALAVIGVSVLYHLLVVRPKSKAYTRNFVHLSILCTLRKHLTQAEHSHEALLTEAEVRSARLIPSNPADGAVLCREGGSGLWHGLHVRLSDVTLPHSFPMAGKTHHEFVVGCWVMVELGRDTGMDCRFLGSHSMMRPSLDCFLKREPDLKQVHSELGQDWVVLGSDDGGRQPSGRWLKTLEQLGKKTDGHVAVGVCGDRLHILLINQILGQKVSQKIAPSPEFEAVDLLPQLSFALSLSDELAQQPNTPAAE